MGDIRGLTGQPNVGVRQFQVGIVRIYRAVDETEAVSEGIVRLRAYLRSIAETASISEAMNRVRAMVRLKAETQAIVESPIYDSYAGIVNLTLKARSLALTVYKRWREL